MSIATKSTNKYGKPVVDTTDIPVYFDVAFAVRLLRQGYHTIVKKCERGELPAFKIGREWRFRKSDIDLMIQSQLDARYALTPDTSQEHKT